MRTAIYARFSSQLQKDSSIEDQVRVCTERAEREGWTVTAVFSDYAMSGAVRDRPGLNSLIEHIRAGGADQILAEAIDRLSRDQEDLAGIHKRVRFLGARIFTLSEGPIDELQIGFKGTMASLFRKDLADKIKRGQGGRVAAGRTPGNIVYGYRKVHRLDSRGEAERGLREIDPEQAEIVRRVYAEYIAGESPLAIARRLNAEGIPSPSGGTWNVSAINGDAVRGNGLLCNEIYIGQLVYNRTTMVRDPDTRKRVPRVNPAEQWQRQDVPHLRIVDDESWEAVRRRKSLRENWDFNKQRRPKRLLSGLVKCGQCGGAIVVIGSEKWGCANTRRAGTCTNRRTIDSTVLESRVLAGLRKELLSPERVSLVVKAYHQHRARLDREAFEAAATNRKRIDELEKQISNLVSAIAAGAADVPEIVEALQRAKAEREQLTEAIGSANAAQVISLHPAIAEAYRNAVEDITRHLNGEEESARTARSALRTLIDAVILTPKENGRGLHIDLQGRLENVVSLATGEAPMEREGMLQVVAEEGLEPPTRGL
ncbi:recombinase family protein [Novosphingobium lindaniclasticum]|uniref:Resolvase n=1 Tax=Novosphingobium lindaniclasticum LE124 TaxID=1096930 RepID=T0IDF1_9SPHN|nr:recombinase family protein [Novosphingobium lindaniclasticum]EQB09690.1 hypothetical protein L284_18990 [Novosphingobium lindaniclasticum LE124]